MKRVIERKEKRKNVGVGREFDVSRSRKRGVGGNDASFSIHFLPMSKWHESDTNTMLYRGWSLTKPRLLAPKLQRKREKRDWHGIDGGTIYIETTRAIPSSHSCRDGREAREPFSLRLIFSFFFHRLLDWVDMVEGKIEKGGGAELLVGYDKKRGGHVEK